MKITQNLKVTGATIVGMAVTLGGNSQTYHISEPFACSLPIAAGAGTPNINSGTFFLQGTINETVTIDPSGLTIRDAGTISFLNGSGSASQNRTVLTTNVTIIAAHFPDPPQTIITVMSNNYAASLTVNYTPNVSPFAFDTGVQSLVWDGQHYTFGGFNAVIDVPTAIDYLYALSGGPNYTGSLATDFFVHLNDSSKWVGTGNYPTSITLNPVPSDFVTGPEPFLDLANFTDANGFNEHIVVTPEPSTLAIGGLAMVAGLIYRKRK